MIKIYDCDASEVFIDCQGLHFHCIFGMCSGAHYLALLNWGVTAPFSAFDKDILLNTENILKALNRSPDVGWLPVSDEARREIARDLAVAVGEIM